MSSPTLKLLFLGSLGLSLLLGNSAAMAQYRNDGVVVPTQPGNGSSTTRTNPYPNDTRPYPTTGSTTTVDNGNRFTCQYYGGQYTVMYQPESQPGQYFAWATPRSLGDGWNAQKRCQTIAQRLESYRPDGLIELQTAVENRENIICVTSEANPSCRIVLTVPPEKDPYAVRNSVFQNLASADNGEQTIGVNTYSSTTTSGGNGINQIYNTTRSILNGGKKPVSSSSKDPINLKPFLDKADRGTATGLRNGVALRQSKPQTSNRLNPNKFR